MDDHPQEAEALLPTGNEFYETNRIDEAIDAYRGAAALRPDHPDLQFNLGAALLAVGRNDEASSCFPSALLLRPEMAERPRSSTSGSLPVWPRMCHAFMTFAPRYGRECGNPLSWTRRGSPVTWKTRSGRCGSPIAGELSRALRRIPAVARSLHPTEWRANGLSRSIVQEEHGNERIESPRQPARREVFNLTGITSVKDDAPRNDGTIVHHPSGAQGTCAQEQTERRRDAVRRAANAGGAVAASQRPGELGV